jgi:hypothetical protein
MPYKSDNEIVSNLTKINAHLAHRKTLLGRNYCCPEIMAVQMKTEQRFRSGSLELLELVSPKPVKMVIDGLGPILRLPLL